MIKINLITLFFNISFERLKELPKKGNIIWVKYGNESYHKHKVKSIWMERDIDWLDKDGAGSCNLRNCYKRILTFKWKKSNKAPSWQQIIKHAEAFSEKRNIDKNTAILCFKECAKFIVKNKK